LLDGLLDFCKSLFVASGVLNVFSEVVNVFGLTPLDTSYSILQGPSVVGGDLCVNALDTTALLVLLRFQCSKALQQARLALLFIPDQLVQKQHETGHWPPCLSGNPGQAQQNYKNSNDWTGRDPFDPARHQMSAIGEMRETAR